MEVSKEKKSKNKIVEIGNMVEIKFVGKLRDNTIFDRSEEGKPLRFEVGAGEVIKGLENAVVGMEIGQEREVEIPPKDAYGGYDPKKVKKLHKGSKEKNLKVNTVIDVKLKDGRTVLASVLDVRSNYVLLDFNHPLAGIKLYFSIKVLDFRE